MREYIYSLMVDKKDGFIASLVKLLLSFVSFFYGILIKIIRPIKILTARKLPCRVVSVGNLTLGGTGKTPTTCMLARLLKKEGKNPTVLIRGYGDDEWKMLESLLRDIPIIVGKDRVASGKKACQRFNADTIVLDDGFQHWRLKRDIDIVLVDSTRPFGNKKLFPRGILREEIKDIRRADIIMLTKTDMGRDKLKDLKNELRNIASIPVLESVHHPLGFYDLASGEKLWPSSVKGVNVNALSSIVNTDYFEFVLGNLGANIISRFHYPDHYNYKARDLKRVVDECKDSKVDTIVTTEKDAVKLKGVQYADYGIRVLVLCVELKVTDGEETLRKRLRSLYRV